MCSNMGSGSGLGGPSGSPVNVKNTRDLVSDRERKQGEVDDVLAVSKFITDRYGSDAVVEQFQVAELGGQDKFSTMAYWDGSNIAVNETFFDKKAIQTAYDRSVKTGYHPPRGSKSAMEATTAHEYGHALTGVAQKRMGESDFDSAAKKIVQEAKRSAGVRDVHAFARSISGYAHENYAECIAEAFSDVYCNGKRAKPASRAVVETLNKYLP